MPRIYTPSYDFKKLEQMAEYIIETKCTLRQCGKKYGVAHSTLGRRFNVHLKEFNFKLYQDLKVVLDINLKERSKRGGGVLSKRFQKSNKEVLALLKKYSSETNNVIKYCKIKNMIKEDIQVSSCCINNHFNRLIEDEKIKIDYLYTNLSHIKIKEEE